MVLAHEYLALMNVSTASILGLIYVVSELGLSLKKRAKSGEARDRNRASLRLLWIVITLSTSPAFNVAIAADHRLVDTGPYRFVRHPWYTGALMAFLDYMNRTKRLIPAVY